MPYRAGAREVNTDAGGPTVRVIRRGHGWKRGYDRAATSMVIVPFGGACRLTRVTNRMATAPLRNDSQAEVRPRLTCAEMLYHEYDSVRLLESTQSSR